MGSVERADNSTEVLSGQVERVTFHNLENGFCVLRANIQGQRDLITIIGHAPTINPGEWITASGKWENDRKFGLQFKSSLIRTTAPSTSEGIKKYLSSGMIHGIGTEYANRLVNHFGSNVFDVIEENPEKLREVDGIGPIRAEKITAGWGDQKVVREIMVFLHQYGVGTARAVRIYKTYGTKAVEVMRRNPYSLAKDIWGIGFKTADTIADRLGVAKDSMIRVRAGISYTLAELMSKGHCCFPRRKLVSQAEKLLEVPGELVESAIKLELEDGNIVSDHVGETECLFLAKVHNAEQSVANHIKRLLNGKLPWEGIDPDRAVPWIEQQTDIELAANQAEAVRMALRSKVLIITGGPGVGKTTIVNSIIKILKQKSTSIVLCAPTGRAAKRMSETTRMDAKTIHRLLEFSPEVFGFKKNEENPLDCDLVVVDECSMVDINLMHSFLKSIPDKCGLLIVGDIDQLPSVGPGQVLADFIQSGSIPVVRLTEVFRQAASSKIINSAHSINRGVVPDLTSPKELTDFYFVRSEEPEQAVERIIELVSRRIPQRFGLDPVLDIQVLCPMNRGGVGARSLNIELQAELNPAGEQKIERFGWTFAPNDKIMQTQNDYDKEIYNGDIGMVEAVDLEENELRAVFDTRRVKYTFGELDSVVPAYATTIHKSQGSEYQAVVIPIMTQHYVMLQRNLLYTAVTRGRELVVLVGQEKAIGIAVRNADEKQRWTKLKEWLMN